MLSPYYTPALEMQKANSGKALKKSIETDISEEDEPVKKSFELE